MSRTVDYELDPKHPSPLTEAQKAEIDALAKKPESEIDTSDIPPLDEAFWEDAVRTPFYRSVKKQLTLRLDADLVDWFKRHTPEGRGYQTHIKDALRQYVTAHLQKAE
jgi:uncharacterized protein (DUF4415 family)